MAKQSENKIEIGYFCNGVWVPISSGKTVKEARENSFKRKKGTAPNGKAKRLLRNNGAKMIKTQGR